MLRSILLPALLSLHLFAGAQEPKYTLKHPRLQYGGAIKTTIDLADHKLHLRLAIGGGVGVLLAPEVLYGSCHVDVVLYNQGMGSPKPGLRKPAIEKDFIAAFTLTGGGDYRFKAGLVDNRKYIPLYYFSNLNRHALQNPFQYSVSFGSNLVYNPARKIKLQRIGFGNINIDGFELTYYNDGPPYKGLLLGDGDDKYYSGGGIISYYASSKWKVNFFELAYFKFTGYHKNAFEIANALDQSFINYHDQDEQKYNKSLFTFGIGSNEDHWAAGVNYYNNTGSDFQHRIHNLIFNAYHRVPYDRTITPYLSYSTYQSKIGLK